MADIAKRRGAEGEMRLVKSKGGYRFVFIKDESAFRAPEPVWQGDDEVTKCPICGEHFGLTRRKHHCRRCGRVVCHDDSKTMTELPRLGYMTRVRCCKDCEEQAFSEKEFYENGLPLLRRGINCRVTGTEGVSILRVSRDEHSLELEEAETDHIHEVPLLDIEEIGISESNVDGAVVLDIKAIPDTDVNITIPKTKLADDFINALSSGMVYTDEKGGMSREDELEAPLSPKPLVGE
eukprot:Clim_evm23s164 gene=Clim_evmTU23s164